MKKLFLSSYFSGVSKLLPDFIGASCTGKKIVFIPTASNVERVTFYVGADKKALLKLGFTLDELDVATASGTEIKNKILGADFIFVEGGNTFYLLQKLKQSGADKLIVEHINKGKIYIGASAGSMIAAPDIEYVKHMDDTEAAPHLKNYSALAMVDFSIVPHFTNFPFKKAAEKIVKLYSDKLDLRTISNNQVVTVVGDKIETLTTSK